MSTSSRQQLMQKGMAALRSGQSGDAEVCFVDLASRGEADAQIWLALAFARVNLDKPDGALEAVDEALQLAPRDLRALLFKADHLDRMGRRRNAISFYQGALQVATNITDIPEDVRRGLQRAAEITERQAADYQDYLMSALQSKGFSSAVNERFQESLDIAFGKVPVYYQQPTRFYYPGLAQRAFFPRDQFPWLSEMEARTDAIRAELLSLLEEEGCFSPYLQHDPNLPQLNDADNVGNMDWSAYFLWRDGELIEENAKRCPQTVEALSLAPVPQVAGQTPVAMFSRLAPGARIAPHHGVLNTRLICHLPLIVPANCGALRVGNHQRTWEEGQAFVFDDSMEHEAWNNSDQDRVVLLFDVWRPELLEEERHWITETLLAVDAYTQPQD